MTTTLVCPECGATFQRPPGGRNNRQIFCTLEHGDAFYNLMNKRGRVAMPFLSVSIRGRHKPAELHTYARRELHGLEAMWKREDAAAGRDPALVVANRLKAGWTAGDVEVPGRRVAKGLDALKRTP